MVVCGGKLRPIELTVVEVENHALRVPHLFARRADQDGGGIVEVDFVQVTTFEASLRLISYKLPPS